MKKEIDENTKKIQRNGHSIPTLIPFPSQFHSTLIPFRRTKHALNAYGFLRNLSQRIPKYLDPLAAESIRFHSKHKEENNIDPDEGNSRLCSACNLPIFSTPFKETELGSGYLHDRCSNLPIDLDGSDLHPSLEPLQKRPNLRKSKCSNCDAVCGDVVYCCRGADCLFQLDVTCAWPVKIMHRSHDHRLTVIRCSAADASFACCACGTGHRPGMLWAPPMPLVYVCSACGFWLHPHCAALPNVVQRCAICGEEVSSWGAYSCTMCHYYVHIMCAVTERQSFESAELTLFFTIFPFLKLPKIKRNDSTMRKWSTLYFLPKKLFGYIH